MNPDYADDFDIGNAQEREEDRLDAERDEVAEWAEQDLADMDKLTDAATAGMDAHDTARLAALNARLGWVA